MLELTKCVTGVNLNVIVWAIIRVNKSTTVLFFSVIIDENIYLDNIIWDVLILGECLSFNFCKCTKVPSTNSRHNFSVPN